MIKYQKVINRSPEWHELRKNGIGGSEIRCLLFEDEYNDPLVLYYDKLGMKGQKPDSEAMFHGRHMEDYVANLWQYWDGKKDEYNIPTYLANFEAKQKVRRCRSLNATVTNTKYPWLFANVDRIINKRGGFSLITGESLAREGVLEIKTTEGFAAEKWRNGIDPSYLAQLNLYLMVCELEYGEVAVLKNGRYLDVFPFERSNMICENILEVTHEFWHKHVLPARKWVEIKNTAEREGHEEIRREAISAIHSLEPETGNSKEVENYIKENYKNDKIEAAGSDELYQLSVKDKQLATIMSVVKDIKQGVRNKILVQFFHQGCEFFNFGDDGRIRYFIKQGSSAPQLGNNIKHRPDKDEIIELLTKTFGL
jgi:predicted phage-related endonuclease